MLMIDILCASGLLVGFFRVSWLEKGEICFPKTIVLVSENWVFRNGCVGVKGVVLTHHFSHGNTRLGGRLGVVYDA